MKLRQGGVWANVDTYIREGGQWKYVNFIRDASELLLIISITTVDLNLQTAFNNAFGITAWTSSIKKRVIINPGVIVGSSSASPFNYALTIPTGLGGTLRVENYGSIQGAGGLPNGGNGGNAIFAGSPVTFNNQGTIYAGGGAGGLGGAGGGGVYTTTTTTTIGPLTTSLFTGSIGFTCAESCQNEFGPIYGGSWYCASASAFPSNSNCFFFALSLVMCLTCYGNITSTSTSYTSGGSGGAGGLGQGFNQNLTGGSGGGGGGINAGTGGTGGTGGNWGEVGGNGFPGSNGNYTGGTGGGSGGLPGYYIVNSGLVTWTNLGAVAGFAI
jgi:hypothetical protein